MLTPTYALSQEGGGNHSFDQILSDLRQEFFNPATQFTQDNLITVFSDEQVPRMTPPDVTALLQYGGVDSFFEFTPSDFQVGYRRQFNASGKEPTFGHWGELLAQGEHVNIWFFDAVTNRPSQATLDDAIIRFDNITYRMTRDFGPFSGHVAHLPFINNIFVGDVHEDGRINLVFHEGFGGGYFWALNFMNNNGNVPIAMIHMHPDFLSSSLNSNSLFAHELQHLLFHIHFGVYENTGGHFLWFNEALSELAWTYWGNEGVRHVGGFVRNAASNSYANPTDERVGDFLNFNNSFKNYGMSNLYSLMMHRATNGSFATDIFTFFSLEFPASATGAEFLMHRDRINNAGMSAIIGDALHSVGLTGTSSGELAFSLMYFLFMEQFASDGGMVNGQMTHPFTPSNYSFDRLWGIRPNLGMSTSFLSNGTSFFSVSHLAPLPQIASGHNISMSGYNGTPPLGASHDRMYRLTGGGLDTPILTISTPDNNPYTQWYVVIPNYVANAFIAPGWYTTLGSLGARVYPLQRGGVANIIDTDGQPAYLFVATLFRNVDAPVTFTWSSGATTTDTLITAAPLTGVTSPTANATPSLTITNGTNFTAALSWNSNPVTFGFGTQYTATITLTADTGYTFLGDFANTAQIAGFSINGIAPTNRISNNGTTLVFEVQFPATATVVNAQAPSIVTHPQSDTVYVDDAVTLSVTATSPDNGTLSFQWQRAAGASGGSFVDILGATSATYTPSTAVVGTNRYQVVVTNTNTDPSVTGATTAITTSNVATVTVNTQSFAFVVSAGAGGTVSGTPSGSMPVGSPISVTAIASVGYDFVDWTVNGVSGVTPTDNPLAFNMPSNPVTLTANFAPALPTVTGVTVTPSNVQVQVGTSQQFAAVVQGTNSPSQSVTWSLNGETSPDTLLTSGLLVVGADEYIGTTLTITATSVADSSFSGSATVTVTYDPPAAVYALTLSPSGNHTFATAMEGYGTQAVHTVTVANDGNQPLPSLAVTLTGSDPSAFELSTSTISLGVGSTDSFTVQPALGLSAGTYTATVTVSDSNVSQSFDVSFTVNAQPTFAVTIVDGGIGSTGDGSFAQATPVTIYAGTRSGYSFDGWLISSAVSFVSGDTSTQTATFTMPNQTVTATATWLADVVLVDPDLVSITAPLAINRTHAQATAGNWDLPTTVGIVVYPAGEPTTASVSWSATPTPVFDPVNTSAQTVVFTGTVTLPTGVTNINAVPLTTTVTVNVAADDTPTTFTVTFDPAGGTRTGGGELAQSVVSGTDATLPIVSRTGFTFAGWSPANAHQNVTSNRTITALWTPISDGGGGNNGGGNNNNGANNDSGANNDTDNNANATTPGASTPTAPPVTTPVTPTEPTPTLPTEELTTTEIPARWQVGATPPAQAPIFIDVSPDAWYADAVSVVTSAGLFQGTAPELFSPSASMTRAMFAQVLANLDGAELNAFASTHAIFADVSPDAWYANAVHWASALGIVSGVGNGNFAPSEHITREQMAVMLFRFTQVMEIDIPVSQANAVFADQASISPWALEAVQLMQTAGILSGRPDASFAPQDTATRAEVATMFARFLDLVS